MLRNFILPLFALYSMFTFGQLQKTDILLVGSDHLNQVYVKDNIHTDVLSPQAQSDIQQFLAQISKFSPDAIMVEELPEEQHTIDSLYSGYKNGSINV